MLCNIAEYLGVTTDYLLGISNTLSAEESAVLEGMTASGDIDFNFLRAFRRTKAVRDNLHKLYLDNVLEALNDNALPLQFVFEIQSICEKYSTISQILGITAQIIPSVLGASMHLMHISQASLTNWYKTNLSTGHARRPL